MKRLNMVDNRTPEQLKADGDDRWSDTSRYTPPHLTGDERRRFIERQKELDRIPTSPGFYWAKWITAAEGTHEGSELTPARHWEVVEVVENFKGEPCEADKAEKFLVSVPGVREPQGLHNFRWGPRVPSMGGCEVMTGNRE